MATKIARELGAQAELKALQLIVASMLATAFAEIPDPKKADFRSDIEVSIAAAHFDKIPAPHKEAFRKAMGASANMVLDMAFEATWYPRTSGPPQ